MAVADWFVWLLVSAGLAVVWSSLLNPDIKTLPTSDTCAKTCYNGGSCYNNTCVCTQGWIGDQCQRCYGRVRLTGYNGTISDGQFNHTRNQRCVWMLDGLSDVVDDLIGDEAPKYIRLSVNELQIECTWDHLFIYDGDSLYGPQLASLTGVMTPYEKYQPAIDISALSGQVFLYFFTDVAVNMSGFNISYTRSYCPYDCGPHGSCNVSTGDCDCKSGYRGATCAELICVDPQNATADEINCFNRCDAESNRCLCLSDNHGTHCEYPIIDAAWSRESDALSWQTNGGRASHASTVHANTMYVVGGFTARNVSFIAKMTLGSLKEEWTDIVPKSGPQPADRYDHSVVFYKDQLIMFGGVLDQKTITNELWFFSVVTETWSMFDDDRLTWMDGNRIIHESNNRSMLALAGHSAHIVDDRMVVLFGYNNERGYSNGVYEFDLSQNVWIDVSAAMTVRPGALLGTYKHASAYDTVVNKDHKQGLIYVYGGYSAKETAAGTIVDIMYSYDPRNRTWRQLESPPTSFGRAVYLHSMVNLDGLLLIVGGNAHNESNPAKRTQCYADVMLAYDIECETWHHLSSPNMSLWPSIQRYGHTAVTYKGSMYLYGGYNGRMLDDVIKYEPGVCSSAQLKSLDACLNQIKQGAKCKWINGTGLLPGRCESYTHIMATKPQTTLRPPSILQPELIDKDDKRTELLPSPTAVDEPIVSKCPNDRSHLTNLRVQVKRDRDSNSVGLPALNKCDYLITCTACIEQPECRWWLTADQIKSGYPEYRESDDIDFETARKQQRDNDTFIDGENEDEDGVDDGSSVGPSARPLKQKRLSTSSIRYAISYIHRSQCPVSCDRHTDCASCSKNQCMWCSTMSRCIALNSYMTAFAYGQCQEWMDPEWTSASAVAHPVQLPISPNKLATDSPEFNWPACLDATNCSAQLTCDACEMMGPRCGWCVDDAETGLGRCLPGSYSGPLQLDDDTGTFGRNASLCPAKDWNFFQCPACQCNGHAKCIQVPVENMTSLSNANWDVAYTTGCDSCQDHTTDDHCSRCESGYYGNALNGGKCTPCMCEDEADDCDPYTGKCYCSTKGVTGQRCQLCDANYKHGPFNNTCFYELSVDFIFTFALGDDKELDRHITKINFLTVPIKDSTDVAFAISCNSTTAMYVVQFVDPNALVNTTVAHGYCYKDDKQSIRHSFRHQDFFFGPYKNSSFLVYVSDFKTPVTIKISFAQTEPLNWITFILIFAACFSGLLIFIGLIWKLKIYWDARREVRNLVIREQHMARRPFGSVELELAFGDDQPLLATPICVEPTFDYRAAVVTVAVRLPTGYPPAARNSNSISTASESGANSNSGSLSGRTPAGQSGLAVASTLCTPHQLKQLITAQNKAGDQEMEDENDGMKHARAFVRWIQRNVDRHMLFM